MVMTIPVRWSHGTRPQRLNWPAVIRRSTLRRGGIRRAWNGGPTTNRMFGLMRSAAIAASTGSLSRRFCDSVNHLSDCWMPWNQPGVRGPLP